MKKIRAVILANEIEDDHLAWVKACESRKEQLEYRVINLTASNWLEEVQRMDHDILLAKPGALSAHYKQLYDERIYILSVLCNSLIFPSPAEIYIYENKRLLSYWLKANGIPHPATRVFYDMREAEAYAATCPMPCRRADNKESISWRWASVMGAAWPDDSVCVVACKASSRLSRKRGV